MSSSTNDTLAKARIAVLGYGSQGRAHALNLRDSGVIIQPYWRKLYNSSVTAVKNFGMHPTYEHDFGKVWLDEA